MATTIAHIDCSMKKTPILRGGTPVFDLHMEGDPLPFHTRLYYEVLKEEPRAQLVLKVDQGDSSLVKWQIKWPDDLPEEDRIRAVQAAVSRVEARKTSVVRFSFATHGPKTIERLYLQNP